MDIIQDPINESAQKHFSINYVFPFQRLVIANILRSAGIDGFEVDRELIGELSPRQIVLLPTGAGKSLCFMLPAFLLDGITLVIFPLLSLLGDQLRRIEAAGLPGAILRGGQSPEEKEDIFRKCRNGGIRMILTNPETLQNSTILKALEGINISHLVIDEAHTVSEWGDTFRPAYLELNRIIKYLNVDIITAFTATASPHILSRIREVIFECTEPNIIFGNPDRTNIRYRVIESANPTFTLLKKVREMEKPLIIFTSSRTSTVLTARMLKRITGFKSIYFYHAGLEKEEKENIEKWFFHSDDGILVATTAYGMGVDKSNIRSVIHLEPPSTVESYLQESGRAGRDRSPAEALLIYNRQSEERLDKIGNELSRQRFTAMLNYGENKSVCRREFLLSKLDSAPEICSGCDICENSIESENYEKQVRSIILKNRGRFTRKEFIFFLKGYKTPHLIDRLFPGLAGFGLFSRWDTEMIEELIDSMLYCGVLRLPSKGMGKHRLTTIKSDMNSPVKKFFRSFHNRFR